MKFTTKLKIENFYLEFKTFLRQAPPPSPFKILIISTFFGAIFPILHQSCQARFSSGIYDHPSSTFTLISFFTLLKHLLEHFGHLQISRIWMILQRIFCVDENLLGKTARIKWCWFAKPGFFGNWAWSRSFGSREERWNFKTKSATEYPATMESNQHLLLLWDSFKMF